MIDETTKEPSQTETLMEKIDELYLVHIHSRILQFDADTVKATQSLIAAIKAEISKL